MTPHDDDRFRVFCSALFRNHLQDWSPEQHLKAVDGYGMRVHVDEAHPERVDQVRTLMEGRLTAEAMTAGKPSAPLVDAWLFGYRFRDTDAAAGDGGDGDGPPGAETREP